MWDENWPERAMCRSMDPDALFVVGARQNEAKRICRACPVRTECLAEALDGQLEYGVWGGTTERERRALTRRRPDVVSWRALLESSRDDQLRAISGTAQADRAQARRRWVEQAQSGAA